MPAEEMVREIAPAVARRRVWRGFRWLFEHDTSFPTQFWLDPRHIYVPEDEALYTRGHMLAATFSRNSFRHTRTTNKTFEDVVRFYKLTEQFLIAHAFKPDDIISPAMLNYCWREGIWENDCLRMICERSDSLAKRERLVRTHRPARSAVQTH